MVFHILRSLRKRIADAAKVPPYVIFHDSTLHEMAVRQPKTIGSLKKIKGIGQAKLEKYGKAFLDNIAEYCASRKIESNHDDQFRLKYPMGYEPWTEDDDIRLKNEYAGGKTINELSVAFRRTKGAIRSRLKKLGVLSQSHLL